ncbi:MAG: hypothetical protein V4747_11350 [Pseudomonadota bacterium]
MNGDLTINLRAALHWARRADANIDDLVRRSVPMMPFRDPKTRAVKMMGAGDQTDYTLSAWIEGDRLTVRQQLGSAITDRTITLPARFHAEATA